jgi:hypothetical protein
LFAFCFNSHLDLRYEIWSFVGILCSHSYVFLIPHHKASPLLITWPK